jgi:alpha-ketoglutarate-dependent 2,4-dichlorophenoxyacetate dioxygenase
MSPLKALTLCGMAIFLLVILVPFWWIASMSFKTYEQIQFATSIYLPSPFTWENYTGLWTETRFPTWLRNSLVTALVVTGITTVVASLGGYAVARLRFPGRESVASLILILYLIPPALLFIPLYRVLAELGATNHLMSLFLSYPTFTVPFCTWLLIGFFKALPDELEEAALIDGAGRVTAFVRVLLPLAAPGLVASAIFAFTLSWNEFLYALVFIQDETATTVPVGLNLLIYGDVFHWGQLMAASVITTIPVVALYVFIHRWMVEGLEASMATITSPLTITPVHPAFGALVSGVDLTRPLDDATFERIAVAFDDHSVLVFHGQALSDAQQMAFSERWGPLETTVRTMGGEDRLGAHIVDLSNTDANGKLMGWDDRRMLYQSGNQLWHSDSSFKPVPAHSSALSARVVPPEGGETEFASMRVAYETLDENVRRDLDRLIVVHSFGFSRSLIDPGIGTEIGRDYPPVRHALVRANPRNGRRSLYIGSHAWYVEGMGLDESRMLLARLLEHTVRADRVYRHHWQVGDLVMWDNRCVLHRGRLWDSARHPRVMHRTTVAGDGPTT